MIKKTEQEIIQNWEGNITLPVVSICCIAYNHEKYIEYSIDSFLMQETNFPFEIIISDDCSSDDTCKILDKYNKLYPRIIKIIKGNFNIGMSKNFERAFENTKGKYIAICEGDDYWIDPLKIKLQKEFLDKNQDFSYCSHAVNIINSTVNSFTYSPYFYQTNNIHNFKSVLMNHFIPTLSLFFRKESLVIPFPHFFYQVRSLDIAIELTLSSNGNCYYDFNKMGVYRHHDNGITKNKIDISKRLEFDCILYEGLKDFLADDYNKLLDQKLARVKYAYAREYINLKKYKIAMNLFKEVFIHDPFFFIKRPLIKFGLIK